MNDLHVLRYDDYATAESDADQIAGDNPGTSAWVVEVYASDDAQTGTLHLVTGTPASETEMTDALNEHFGHTDWDTQYTAAVHG